MCWRKPTPANNSLIATHAHGTCVSTYVHTHTPNKCKNIFNCFFIQFRLLGISLSLGLWSSCVLVCCPQWSKSDRWQFFRLFLYYLDMRTQFLFKIVLPYSLPLPDVLGLSSPFLVPSEPVIPLRRPGSFDWRMVLDAVI